MGEFSGLSSVSARMAAALALAASIAVEAAAQTADRVSGTLVQFTDNGGWCWYQDERVIVDAAKGTMLVASLANRFGVGGSPKDGDVDVAHFDLATRSSRRFTLKDALLSYGAGDDHNVAALLRRPSGGYLSMYTGHNNDKISYYRLFDAAAGTWGAEKRFDWNTMPGGADFNSTYSNLFHLSAEKRTYNFARGDDKSPNFMVSADEGSSWTYGGQLTRPDTSIGYVNGYFKYASDGVDRIHFTATEFHPRDFNTSLYHGYVQGGKSFNSSGTVVDNDLSDKVAPLPAEFTPVFKANTTLAGTQMTRCWNIDLQAYPSGELGFLFKCRAGNSETDHRFLHARLSQGQWTVRYLARAGAKLFSTEQDYTGLGALDPKHPYTLYLSTSIDPATDQALANHEIFKGISSDGGATWTWSALTRQSTRDNFRPVIPAWEGGGTALIWFRGTMTTSQNYDGAMVGLFLPDSSRGMKAYVDASPQNTRLASGGPFAATGPSASMGAAEGQWHLRSGFGNGNGVYASAESGAEDAPSLRTAVTGLPAGTYDLWAHFWANPSSDWRLKAGLRAESMQVYRSMASRQVEAGEHATPVVLAGSGSVQMYEAYLGRVALGPEDSLAAFIDDHAVRTGTADSLSGDAARTWYDGISYRQVGSGPTALKPANRKARIPRFRSRSGIPDGRDVAGRKSGRKYRVP